MRPTQALAGWNNAQLRGLLPFLDEACVPPGTVLAEAGCLCHQFVIVVSGVLETCRDGGSGRLEAGDMLGWNAMRDRGSHEATVRSVSAAHFLAMSHAQFRAAEALAPNDLSPTLTTGSRSLGLLSTRRQHSPGAEARSTIERRVYFA
ncbi:MAG TPA: cyclic nucleotide-binding domain-containing protein [Candidatus Dormibacteraeota bacterium]|nr:cyclic nucleotide-binding domain-containing protein [Candidatus Dormibacteraeota bacterium]